MVLARREHQHVAPVDHHDEARFLADEEFLDHDPRAGRAHAVVDQHRVDRGVGLVERRRDDHALARGQAVGLDDDRGAAALDVGVRQRGVGEGLVLGGRDAMALHERLREVLRRFELGGRPRGAEDPQPATTEQVDDARGQRRLGADDGEGDAFAFREIGERVEVGDRQVLDARLVRGAAVARRDEDLVDPLGLREPPGQRVLAPAGSHHHHFHRAASWPCSSKTALV